MTNKYKSIKMKTSTTQRSEEGFAAVTVMVISLLGGLIVFDTVKENVNQERMAGNYSKELNARLQAENGLAAAYNELSAHSTLTSGIMMSQLNAKQNNTADYHYELSDPEDESENNTSDEMLIESEGSHYEGNYKIRGSISLSSSLGNNVFKNAITTCDGATLSGSGKIDSYDSLKGNYGGENISDNGDVSVLNNSDGTNSGLNISGETEDGGDKIKGDLSISGPLTLTDGVVTGNVHVTGNLTTGTASKAAIAGSIEVTGNVDYLLTGNSVYPENIKANGDVSIGQSDYDNPILYGGDNLESKNTLTNAKSYEEVSNIQSVQPMAVETCDILNLNKEFYPNGSGVSQLANIAAFNMKFAWDAQYWKIGQSGITSSVNGTDWSEDKGVKTQEIEFLGNLETPVYVLDIDGLSYDPLSLIIEKDSNITIYLKNATTIGGDIKVEDGASLTIITDKKVTINSDGNINDVLDGNSTDTVSTTLYSNYSSQNKYDYGLTVGASSDIGLTVYAPTAAINVTGSGDLYGSLRSDYLNISGSGGVHFDEQITNKNIGNSESNSSGVLITRWF